MTKPIRLTKDTVQPGVAFRCPYGVFRVCKNTEGQLYLMLLDNDFNFISICNIDNIDEFGLQVSTLSAAPQRQIVGFIKTEVILIQSDLPELNTISGKDIKPNLHFIFENHKGRLYEIGDKLMLEIQEPNQAKTGFQSRIVGPVYRHDQLRIYYHITILGDTFQGSLEYSRMIMQS